MFVTLLALRTLILEEAPQLFDNEIFDDFLDIIDDLDCELSKESYCEKNPNAKYNECNEEE